MSLQIPVSVLCELPLKRGVHGPMGPRGRQVSGCGARMGWVGRLLQVRLPYAGSGEPTLVAVFTSDVRSQAVTKHSAGLQQLLLERPRAQNFIGQPVMMLS